MGAYRSCSSTQHGCVAHAQAGHTYEDEAYRCNQMGTLQPCNAYLTGMFRRGWRTGGDFHQLLWQAYAPLRELLGAPGGMACPRAEEILSAAVWHNTG